VQSFLVLVSYKFFLCKTCEKWLRSTTFQIQDVTKGFDNLYVENLPQSRAQMMKVGIGIVWAMAKG
jgi:hypothetical protein